MDLAASMSTDPSGWWLVAAGGIGAVVAIIGNAFAGWLARRHFVADRARDEARSACVDFLRDASYCAHLIGNLAPSEHSLGGDAGERKEAAYYFDRETSDRFRVVEVSGNERVVEAGRALREELKGFRDKMCDPNATLPRYRDETYVRWYDPVVKARNAFVEVVRRELGVDA